MSNFKLTDSNLFILKGTEERFIHLGTILSGVREYICMVDMYTDRCYIEEVTGGHMEFINDDKLAYALAKFCAEKEVNSPKRLFEYIVSPEGKKNPWVKKRIEALQTDKP